MIETFDGVKIHAWLIMHKNASQHPTLVKILLMSYVTARPVGETNVCQYNRSISMAMQEIWVFGKSLHTVIVPLLIPG